MKEFKVFEIKSSRYIQFGLASILGLGSAALLTTASPADAALTEVSQACSNANVVLSVGAEGAKEEHLSRIRQFLFNKKVWVAYPECSDGGACADPFGYQTGVAGKVQIRTWNASPNDGGSLRAYSLRCGAGGTCNEIAKLWASEYKNAMGEPHLWCGDYHSVLRNPVVESPR